MIYDIAVIGAGISGASVAAELAPHRGVVLIEAEDMPGYHSTGRSAAFWAETYGGPALQPLTTASRDFLAAPPLEFSEHAFLERRGKLHVAQMGSEAILDQFMADFADSGVELERLDREGVLRHLPGAREQWCDAIYEPSCADIDVAGLHQAYLRAARQRGADLACNARVERAERQGGIWKIAATGLEFRARTIVNAAGAWTDEIARIAGAAPIGVKPLRRTVIQLLTEPEAPADLPLVIDANGEFYFKGEAGGRIWLSPHDETPDTPRDVAPEEIDVALAIDRFENVVDWKVSKLDRKWAGLRSFAPDRLPVYGFDTDVSGFFWCAGQGGSGIQTSPAASQLCKALLLDRPLEGAAAIIHPARYAPQRFA